MRTLLDLPDLPHIMDVPEPDEMLADFLIAHQLSTGELAPDGEFSVQGAPLAVLEEMYPGATVDEFGVMTGGWPTEYELAFHRLQNDRRP